MKVICSYCQRILGETAPYDVDYDTHDICGECFYHYQQQWSGMSLGRYLDDFGILVSVTDSEGKVVAASQVMADRMGKSDRVANNLMGAKVTECAHARKKDGCGRDRHAAACAVRRALTSIAMGDTDACVPGYIENGRQRSQITVTAQRVGNTVLVRFNPDDDVSFQAA